MFGDERMVANARLLLPAASAAHLRLEHSADEASAGAGRAFRPHRKVMTLVHAVVAGGDCINDTDVLHAGQGSSGIR